MTGKATLKSVAQTHPGRVRDHNEDCYFADLELGLFLVADGMGGMEAGEVASALARDEVVRAVTSGASLPDAIQSAHKAIRRAVDEGIGAAGMGTTLVAAQMKESACQIAWVGDSRAYLWDAARGSLRRLSRDHSHVEMLLASGVITPEQAHKHPQKNLITQCLGQMNLDSVQVGDVTEILEPGQCVLLCSDGLNDELTDTEIAQCLVTHHKVDAQAESLISLTLEKGARDNVTVVLLQTSNRGLMSGASAKKPLLFAMVGIVLGISALLLFRYFLR